MACVAYKNLVIEWSILVWNDCPDWETIDAYWHAVEHRSKCVVCGRDNVVLGCNSVYRMVAPSINLQDDLGI